MGSHVLERFGFDPSCSGKPIHMGEGGAVLQLWRAPHRLSVAENCNTRRNSPSETGEWHHNEIWLAACVVPLFKLSGNRLGL